MSAISEGDLVMVVRWPHRCLPRSSDKAPGMPFRVTFLGYCSCKTCGQNFGIGAGTGITQGIVQGMVPLAWLKKIEPDQESEGSQQPTWVGFCGHPARIER